MSDIRVVVADDSVVVRRIMADVFARADGFALVATATDGKAAVDAVTEHIPDVVVLDIEMPRMDGIEALQAIRKLHPDLPVVMFSTVAKRGAAATLEALALGASDYVTKPSSLGGVRETIEAMESALLPRLRGLVERPVFTERLEPTAEAQRKLLERLAHQVDAIAIGASTGGPVAVTRLVRELPADFPIPIAVVQHMPPLFTKHFAEQLSTHTALPVREAQDGDVFRSGGVWIAPGGKHLVLRGGAGDYRLGLTEDEPVHSCRPSVDVLFRSVSRCCGARGLAIVMTGMGQDGTTGARTIVEAGGAVMAQDEESSVVWGMPGSVARAGIAGFLGDPVQLSQRLTAHVAGAWKGSG